MNASFLLSLLALILHAMAASAADDNDVRSKVGGRGRTAFSSLEIDPDNHIYGVPFGTSEDDFIKTAGKPDGYVRLNEVHTALLYGHTHAFVFEAGKLAGVRITRGTLEWRLAKALQDWSVIDHRDWRLSSGVVTGMNRKEIRELLGEKLVKDPADPTEHHYYKTAKARVDLDFSFYPAKGEGDEAYRLYAIYVTQTAPVDGEGGLPRRRASRTAPAGSLHFGGIGAMLQKDRKSGAVEIMSVMPDSPADKAGLKKGVIIRAIDDTPTKGRPLDECAEALRGQVGSKVKLEVFDRYEQQDRVVELTRAEMVSIGNELRITVTNPAVTTDQVLRLDATNGACAVIQFLGFTTDHDVGSGEGQSTATYRWRFRASPGAPTLAGTNTAVDRYTRKVVGPNRYNLTRLYSPEGAKVKAGDIELEWSYGYTNKGFIKIDPSALKSSVHDLGEFEKGP